MKIGVKTSALRETKWHEYAVRFLLGGAITALAGWIAKRYGPGVGGLFLAFPAIFPASATLVEKHETKKKEHLGLHGKERGKDAAGIDAAGAAMGSIGLLAFGACVWWLAPRMSAWIMLPLAVIAWAGASFAIWAVRQKI